MSERDDLLMAARLLAAMVRDEFSGIGLSLADLVDEYGAYTPEGADVEPLRRVQHLIEPPD